MSQKISRLAPALALALLTAVMAAGCGGDGNSDEFRPSSRRSRTGGPGNGEDRTSCGSGGGPDPAIVTCRARSATRSFAWIREAARLKGAGPDVIQCHVEDLSTPSKRRPRSVYIESEDWRVTVAPDGTVSEPVIFDGYRIGDFLRKDHRLGCSVEKAPQERCKSPFAGGQ